MGYNVVAILKECLRDFGREDLIIDALDNHSTITIDIDKRPSINITDHDGVIMFWATVGEYNEYTIGQVSGPLLAYQLEASYPQFSVGQPVLCKGDVNLELCASLQPMCFDSKENFSAALEHFFNHMIFIHDILNK